jgi:hypothetical protein
MQANLSMYTKEALAARAELRTAPFVVHGIYRWWLFLGGGEWNFNTGYISKKAYVAMCTLTEQVNFGYNLNLR